MQGGKRKLSAWNIFVSKIYHEGLAKNSKYSFKQALSDASERKSEMKSMNLNSMNKTRKNKYSKKSKKNKRMYGGKSKKCRK